MASRPQLECVIGESGAGKSLYVSAFQCVAFLRDETGDYWHNLPLKPEGLAKLSGKTLEEVESRLKLIPADELQKWIAEKSGPWEFFRDKDIKAAHIAIDEAHRYFGKKHSKQHLANLGEWTGGLRHNGATAQLITQHEFKLSTDARNEAGVQTRIFSPNQLRERLTGAKWYDVLQLMNKFRGRKIGLTVVREGIQQGKSARDFRAEGFRYIFHRPEHYACYDSYNNINAEGAHDGSANRPKEEWERFTWPRLLLWYVERNFIPTGIRAGFLCLMTWLFLLGGLGTIVDGFFATTMASMQVLGSPAEAEQGSKAKKTGLKEPEPTMAALPQDKSKLEELAKHNQYLAARLVEASEYAEQLTGLVAVIGESAYWADGSTAKVGETVTQGPFAGRTVESVDAKAGKVELSGGTVLRIGVLSPAQYQRVREWQAAANNPPVSTDGGFAVPNSAPPRNLSGGSPSLVPIPDQPGREWRPRNSQIQRDPDQGVLQPPRRSIRMLRGGGTGLGQPDDHSGLSRNPPQSVPGNSSETVGGGTGRTPGPVLPRNEEAGRQGGNGPQDPQAER